MNTSQAGLRQVAVQWIYVHPELRRVSDAAFRLHVAALIHSRRNGPYGRVAEAVVRRLPRAPTTRARLQSALAELERAGLWERDEHGWQIAIAKEEAQ